MILQINHFEFNVNFSLLPNVNFAMKMFLCFVSKLCMTFMLSMRNSFLIVKILFDILNYSYNALC